MPEIGEVILQKRKGARSVRITVGHNGIVRVSMPTWSPYAVGESFARSKLGWINKHQQIKQPHVFSSGERVGKAHRIHIYHERRDAISARVTATEINIRIPASLDPADTTVQTAVQKAAVRALKQEAKLLLPGRLRSLAQAHDFEFRSVDIKLLKSRWGSCNSRKEIALSCYLMQLPWDLIDYVLLHELVHTHIMAHGPRFWNELSQYVSDLPAKRKTIRAHQPALIPQD